MKDNTLDRLFESTDSLDNYNLSSSSPRCVYYQRRIQQPQQQKEQHPKNYSASTMTKTLDYSNATSTPTKVYNLYYRSWNTILNVIRNKKLNIWIGFVLCIAVVGIDTYYYQCTGKLLETIGILIPDISLPNTLEQSHQHGIGLGTSTSNNRHVKNTKIPHILIFTHHVNLLTTNLDSATSDKELQYTWTRTTIERKLLTRNISNTTRYGFTSRKLKELRVLQDNVHRIINLHKGPIVNVSNTDAQGYNERHNNKNLTVRFLTDDDCIQSIRQWAYMSSHQNHTIFVHHKKAWNIEYTNPENIANELISYFQKEPMGMYKADLCRGVALYETGGIYMDVDLGTRMNIFDLLLHTTEFATIKVHPQIRYPGAYFQAFIAVTKHHDIIHRYIELFVLYYRGTIKIRRGLIGVTLLKRAHDEIQSEQELIIQQNDENQLSFPSSSSPILPLTPVQQTTELWQEVYYKVKYHNDIFADVPIPNWGNCRACKFVVVIPPPPQQQQQQTQSLSQYNNNHVLINNNNSNNMTTTSTSSILSETTIKTKLIVPMYSRIAGSRMCP